MFDTMKVAHKIKEARISRNMTQMNMADAMEVSYQAVSNWESGSSCPDISKLEPLCRILHISMYELLGTESIPRVLNRVLNKEGPAGTREAPITMDEIQEFAPILPPADVERLVNHSLEQQKEEKIKLKAIIGIAPFLDDDFLDELVTKAQVESLQELTELAPYLSEDALDTLVKSSDAETDMDAILALAPFLDEDTLDWLVKKMLPLNDFQKLSCLMSYLCEDTLEAIALGMEPQKNMDSLISLAPSLREETLDKVVDKISDFEQIDVSPLYPYLSHESLQKVAKALMKIQNLDALKDIVSYI